MDGTSGRQFGADATDLLPRCRVALRLRNDPDVFELARALCFRLTRGCALHLQRQRLGRRAILHTR